MRKQVEQEMQDAQQKLANIENQINQLGQQRQQVIGEIFEIRGMLKLLDRQEGDNVQIEGRDTE